MTSNGWWYLRGHVVIKIKGPRPERFINSAVRAGFELRQIERLAQEMLVATVNAATFHKLRILARQGGYKIAIVNRLGLPFALHKLFRRRGLALGGILGLLILYGLSSFIWFVNVEGAVDVPPDQILHVAHQAGLHPGIARMAFSGKVVERELLMALDRLAWVNVQVHGTLATISVAEKAVPDVQLRLPGDVVAAKDGVVEELVTLRGIPVVAEGDVVHAGQLLISGLLPPQDPAHKEKVAKGEPPYLHADGIVKAQVWHEGVAEADYVSKEEQRTGHVNRRLLWQWQDRQGSLGKPAAFAHYQEKLFTVNPGIGRFRLPGRLILEQRAEIVIHTTPLDPDLARENALAAAWEQVQAALPTGAAMYQPPQVQIEVVGEGDSEFVRARVTVVAIEDIKLFEPVPGQESKDGVYRPVIGPPHNVQPVPGP